MQEEVNEKVIALSIKTGKLSAEVLQKSMKFFLSQIKKQANKRQMPHGKQTLKQLMKQNAGVSNIEITKDNIKAFESTAKKYGIDFALKKDVTESPPRYWKAMTAITENGHRERRNYSNRLHKHWLHDTRTHWKIHVPHAYN